MANRLTTFGNDLYTGKRSFNFVGSRKKLVHDRRACCSSLSVLVPDPPRRFNFGIEFRGGSQFQIARRRGRRRSSRAIDAVASVVPDADRARHDRRRRRRAGADRPARAGRLARGHHGPRRGLRRARVRGHVVVHRPELGCGRHAAGARRPRRVPRCSPAIIMALYFRTWKMSLAAILALLARPRRHGRHLRAPSASRSRPPPIIGFLTILGYSLYDTVVVFDKIRENTAEDGQESRRTFARVGEPRGQPDPRALDQHRRRRRPAGRGDPLHRRVRARRRHAARHLARAVRSASLVGTYSTVVHRGAALRRSCARVSRRSAGTTRRC